jgi:hypothetical protein
VSIGSAIKSAWAKFADRILAGLRGSARGIEGEDYKTGLAEVIKAVFADGENAEKARVTEILHAPGAEELPQLAMFLVLGDATAVQATSILAKAENDASKRVAMTRGQQVESAITLH